MKKVELIIMTVLTALLSFSTSSKAGEKEIKSPNAKIVVAYVTSWSDIMPDPKYMTHINYAFGHVNETFDGISIDNENRLKQIVALKAQKKTLKVLLSVGGWGSGRFSEMSANKKFRKSFAKDCKEVVKKYDLDGIDIDWEYPTSSEAKISSSPNDTENFSLMIKEIRKAIGRKKTLTIATVASAEYIDFKAILSYIDFVNVMSYDMASAPKLHSALFRSENSGNITGDEAIIAHLKAGVPPSKLVMGMPFYGRGGNEYPNFKDYKEDRNNFEEKWDSIAKVPYLINKKGIIVFGFEDSRSLAIKCQYILSNNLLGGMYWDYAGDNANGDLRRTVYENLIERKPYEVPRQVLVLTERGGQHGGFTDAGMRWLAKEGDKMNFVVTEINNAKPITKKFISRFQLIIQLDFPPYTWPEEAQKAFIQYIEEGKGGWIGFHHATLLGEFDGYPMWQWFSDFMGGIRFQNYIAARADGTVIVEDAEHPVMKGLPASFVIPGDEWYTYDKSPRPNVHVLSRVDESSYSPASDIKMGDHPVIWTNEEMKARNVYFQMGHSKVLYDTEAFTEMFENAIRWTLSK